MNENIFDIDDEGPICETRQDQRDESDFLPLPFSLIPAATEMVDDPGRNIEEKVLLYVPVTHRCPPQPDESTTATGAVFLMALVEKRIKNEIKS